MRETPKKGANEIVLLADNSVSLSVKEGKDTPARSEQLRAALISADGTEPSWLQELRKDFRIRMQAIDERSLAITDARSLTFDGTASRLIFPTLAARSPQAGSNTSAVILVTDGLATDAGAWPGQVLTEGAPVFPVLIGEKAPAQDLSLTDTTASQTAFEDSPVTVTARVSQNGFSGRPLTLTIADETGKKLAGESHTFGADEKQHVFRTRVPLAKPGVSFLRVAVQSEKTEEAIMANNTRLISVDRGTGPYRVLYVGGRPNWDYKFLRRSITADPEVQMPALLRIAKREPKFEWRGRPGETSNPLFKGFGAKGGEDVQRYDQPVLIRLNTRDEKELLDGFPKTAEALLTDYRAIILDDIEADFFSQEQMNLIERFVSIRGGSLLMLGGQETFGPGKYEHTSVGRMLPVYLDKLASGPALLDVRYNLTREGWLEPWTRLKPEQADDEQRLSLMPGFNAVNQVFSIKPGASVLATITDKNDRSMPALVTQKFGNGRVLAFTIGDVWRWGMKDAEQQNDMQKHWRQIVRHLIVDVPDRVELRAVASEDGLSHQLQARVKTLSFGPQDDAAVSFTVVHQPEPAPGSKTKPAPVTTTLSAEPSLKESGLYESIFHTTSAGTYLATAVVKDPDGKPLAEKTAGWTHNPLADETRILEPNRQLLERIAAGSKGKFLKPSQLDELPGLISRLQQPVTERKTTPLWHHPLYLGAILALLIGEWVIRRRSGWI